MKNEAALKALVVAVLASLNIESKKYAVRRRTTPSRGKKGVEVMLALPQSDEAETTFNRLRDAMMDEPDIVNVESLCEVERGADMEFFIIEAEFTYTKGA